MGHHLANLPADPRLGKLLVLGAILGCLGPVVTIAACMSHRSPFAASFEKQEEVERHKARLAAPAPSAGANLASGQQSDHLLMAAAYELWRSSQSRSSGSKAAAVQAAKKNGLSIQTLEALSEMRAQFATMLADIRFVQPPSGEASRFCNKCAVRFGRR